MTRVDRLWLAGIASMLTTSALCFAWARLLDGDTHRALAAPHHPAARRG